MCSAGGRRAPRKKREDPAKVEICGQAALLDNPIYIPGVLITTPTK